MSSIPLDLIIETNLEQQIRYALWHLGEAKTRIILERAKIRAQMNYDKGIAAERARIANWPIKPDPEPPKPVA